MRNIYFLICFVLSVGTIGFFSPFFDLSPRSSSSERTLYAVEIAQLKYPVYTDYFENVEDVIELNDKNGAYHYVVGVTDSKEKAKERMMEVQQIGYPKAILVDVSPDFFVDRTLDSNTSKQEKQDKKITKQSVQKAKNKSSSKKKLVSETRSSFETKSSDDYNMGRKMRGKEYVHYYYDLSTLQFSKKPVFLIEVGVYNDEAEAAEAVQKLKDLGFTKAQVKKPVQLSVKTRAVSSAAAKHFSIQIFASKSDVSSSRFTLEGLTKTYDPNDELYRYLYGDYDNYWACRRELRNIRQKGYPDAFIVKL